jgi:hypothetical protein
MNVLWVAQDNNKDGSFKQTKAEVLCTASCVMFVKHYFPQFKTNLFVDNHTSKYYEQFGLLDIFDNVDNTLLNQDFGVNLKVYWAAGKIFAQSLFDGPTLMMDLDFRFFTEIDKLGFFDSDVSCLWLEEIENEYYLNPKTAMSYTYLNWKLPWDIYALNTSFLYFRNDFVRKKYCDLGIEYMRSNYKILPSNMTKIENSRFMMFVEQYMLKQISNLYKQKITILIDDFYPLPKNNRSITSCGINMKDSRNYFYHYGDHKTKHMVKKDQFCLNEIENCYRVTNHTITNDKHLDIFNKIYKIDINEGCFC